MKIVVGKISINSLNNLMFHFPNIAINSAFIHLSIVIVK